MPLSISPSTYQHLAPTQIHPKVAAGGLGGALATLVILAASLLFRDELSKYGPLIATVASAITGVASFFSGYLKAS